MEQYFCLFIILAIITLIIFIYLRNTAKKSGQPPKNVAGKEEYLPVYISIGDKPDTVVRGMNSFVTQVQKTESAGDKWRYVPMLIFFAGLGSMGIDLLLILLGYRSYVFITGGVLFWVCAVIMARSLRKSDSKNFSPRYKDAKTIVYTLRDDLKPGSTLNGHLDLTGDMLKTKVARETKDTRDRTTQHFRDEWLALKAKLYDGNILRLSMIQKTKKRGSYWKRSRVSGKMKMKPEKYKGSQQFIKLRIVVNPELYKITSSPQFKQGMNIGKFTVMQLVTEGGIIDVTANSPFDTVEYDQILGFAKSAYSLLQRKAS